MVEGSSGRGPPLGEASTKVTPIMGWTMICIFT